MRRELLRGHLDVMLLAAVEREPLHGYAIIEALRRRSDGRFDLPEGTIYPGLYRLERAGLLKSHTVRVSGRNRRIYQLTVKGQAALRAGREEWRQFSTDVAAVLEGAS